MDFISVNDELQDVKKRIRAMGKEVIRIEKVGNGNMSAFQLFYREAGGTEVKTTYFWRHDVEAFLEKFAQTN
jgi:hypothetical protein